MNLTPWYDIYRERMNESYTNHVANKYATFIQAIISERRVTDLTEVGCGAGNITKILRQIKGGEGYVYNLIDSCPKMLSLAMENNASPECNFKCADVREVVQSDVDLVHSHGLLEHFDDASIRHIVKMCRMAAPVQIHYVPGARYEKPSRGDERLMEPGQWRDILSGLGKVLVYTFNDEHDLIIRLER